MRKNVLIFLISFIIYIMSGILAGQCAGMLQKTFYMFFMLSFATMMFNLFCIIKIRNIGIQTERR